MHLLVGTRDACCRQLASFDTRIANHNAFYISTHLRLGGEKAVIRVACPIHWLRVAKPGLEISPKASIWRSLDKMSHFVDSPEFHPLFCWGISQTA
jgi:hypothetical protein